MNGLTAVALAATTVTGVVALIRRLGGSKAEALPVLTWPILALVVGVGFTLGWHVNFAPALVGNVPALVDASSRLAGTSGEIVSGIVAGLAAGFLHDAFDLIRSKTQGS